MTTDALSNQPLSRLSVLVSSFNKIDFLHQSERYLQELSTLGAQVIIIEDSSTDGSIERMLEWPKVKTSEIELIIQRNSGSAVSRNNAVTHASRDYLLFVDIDDEVSIPDLLELFPKLLTSEAEIALSGYIQVPSNRPGPFPLNEYQDLKISISEHRTELLNAMGWWRFIYAKSLFEKYDLMFLPTFADMGGKIFVLDDLFWLIHLFSLDFALYRANAQTFIYRYFLPDEQTEERKVWYQSQVQLMPKAMGLFLRDLKNHKCKHDREWLLKSSQGSLWQHANFLNLRKFLQSSLSYTKTSIQIDVALKNWSFIPTFNNFARTTLRLSYLSMRKR